MLLINIIGILIILLNIAGLVYLILVWFRNVTGNYNKNLSKIRVAPRNNINSDNNNIIEESIIREKDDMLDDLDLSDFDDLNLDDFD